jgi:class 3 adenylate cyclase
VKRQIWLVLVFNYLLWCALPCNSQNQKLADSLIQKLNDYNGTRDTIQFEWMSEISFNHNNPDTILFYARLLGSETKDNKWSHIARYHEGSALRMMGDLDGALEAYFNSLEHAQVGDSSDSSKREGMSFIAIGDVYSISGAHQNSIEYYSKSIIILRELKDSLNLATVLLNLGDEYFNDEKYDKALQYFNESGIIFNKLNYLIGKAYNLGNVGMVYAEQGKDALAEKNINEAIRILEETQDYSAISVYLTYMADIYARKNQMKIALAYAQRSLDLSKKYKLKKEISEANQKLSELYEKIGNQSTSYKYYKEYIAYRDSVSNMESMQQMADLRTNYEVSQNQIKADYEISQKQTEVNLLNQQKKNQQLISLASGIGLLLIIVVAIGLYRRNNFINKAKLLVENEKERSDSLLLNILPEQTANELKHKGKVQAKRFDSVSVMFTDFKGFTAYSDKLSPEELVDSIDFYYSKFDDIIEKHGLEKIKTVGDAYMCAGGLPFPTKDHSIQMVEAAIEIAEFVNESKKVDPDAMTRFDIRIGINTGPVVAGVVGKKKFAYDIWGDTVNIASRMESNSEPGKINISDNTYQLTKDRYQCSYRGEIQVKNKGMMKMYFVEGILQNQTSNAAI